MSEINVILTIDGRSDDVSSIGGEAGTEISASIAFASATMLIQGNE